jgi:hypothetical protein
MTNDKPRAAAYDPAIVAANRAAITDELHRIGNDRLRLVGSPVRHYLDPVDGRWHLGIPTAAARVPYSRDEQCSDCDGSGVTMFNEPCGCTRHNGSTRRVAGGRGRRVARARHRPLHAVLEWLDGPILRRFPAPRLVVALGVMAVALVIWGLIVSGS